MNDSLQFCLFLRQNCLKNENNRGSQSDHQPISVCIFINIAVEYNTEKQRAARHNI